jgi:hypothetical protein
VKYACHRYEIMWERECTLSKEIADAWSMGGMKETLGDISQALRGVMKNLRAWSVVHFGSIRRGLESLRKQLEALRNEGADEDSAAVRAKISRMDELLYREEMLWLQR